MSPDVRDRILELLEKRTVVDEFAIHVVEMFPALCVVAGGAVAIWIVWYITFRFGHKTKGGPQ